MTEPTTEQPFPQPKLRLSATYPTRADAAGPDYVQIEINEAAPTGDLIFQAVRALAAVPAAATRAGATSYVITPGDTHLDPAAVANAIRKHDGGTSR